MTPGRPTLLALLLGVLLGFALATSDGVRASRQPEAAGLPWREASLMAEVIDRVKTEYVDPVADDELMRHALRGMVAGLDPHSSFLDQRELEDLRVSSEGRYSGVGIEVSLEFGQVVVVAPLEGSPAERAGLQTGDVIVSIDGHLLRAAALEESIGLMRGEPGTTVRVGIERNGLEEPLEYVIRRELIEVQNLRHALLEPGYGYLRIAQFADTTPQELDAALAALVESNGGALAGLVLDLRGNPGGVLEAGVDVADSFLESGLIVRADGRTEDARFSMEAAPGDLLAGAPLALLVNGGSASASEIVAGALHDHGRARLFGRTTFGKGSVQTVLPLSDGEAIKLTTSRYYTPRGTAINERGIDPDVVLPRADTADAAAEDAELRVALDWLKAQPVAPLALARRP